MLRGIAGYLVVGVALSACFAACSSSSGTPSDAGQDTVIDGLARTDTGSGGHSTGTDAQDATVDKVDASPDRSDTADAHDGGSGGATGSGGSADAGAGGMGMGGMGMGGAIDAGMGGAAGSSMGGSGSGGSGMGGVGPADGGIDAPDSAQGGADGSTDTPADGAPPTDGGSDASGPACGAGCPANVQPSSLMLWLSADVGVSCDHTLTPPRVSSWNDRRANSTVTLTPVPLKVGPLCDGMSLAGVTLPFFDRTTTDVDTGILRADLTPLNNQNYTVFVVERRRSADARYILGTDVPFPDSIDCLNDNDHLAYRFGYRSPVLFGAGSFTSNADEDCADPSVTVPTYSTPQAMLEVERLEAGVEHTMTIGGTSNPSDDVDQMGSLMQGYLGRAFQAAFGSDSRYLGEVAEVVIYKSALDQTDIDAVSSYLKSRWGL